MEKDFHYHLIYAIAKITGMNNPDIITYSSQFVDDNNEGQFFVDKKNISFPDRIQQTNGEYYYPIMTQSLSPKSLDLYIQKYVYVPFHFLPGDNTVIINEKGNALNTTPNSINANKILSEALDSKNPYQIGIALHAFADTWSHQNFTGLREDWNAVYPWYNVFKSLVPNIGHAEVGHSPDIISEKWTDYRLKKVIDNTGRAFEAIKVIFSKLREKTNTGPVWGDIEQDFKDIVNIADYDSRIKKIVEFVSNHNGGDIPRYSPDNWINEALNKTTDSVIMKSNFTNTNWYKFHQAAKKHFAFVMSLISDLI